MTTPFKAYTDFMALRAHFTSKYDYFKYQGSLKWITEVSYQKRKDKYFFERLAKRKDYKDFLIANFIQQPKIWITALGKPEAEEIFFKWKKTMQSLSYIFRTELRQIPEEFKLFDLLKCENLPLLIVFYLSHDISLETFCILLKLVKIKKFWDGKVNFPEWKDLSPQVEKYTPFISFDEKKMKEIVHARFEDANLFITEC